MPRVLAFYEKAFPNDAPDEQFWKDFETIEDSLARRAEERPLSAMAIDKLLAEVASRIKNTAGEARKRCISSAS